ncbi:MAG: hypothetical protein PHC64_07930 [Candidatus Gastranaerophilales bacterium]|nr:hypothetical protein [Candidatus Gastranaerophilales bacterium]
MSTLLIWEISNEAKTTQNNIINFKSHSIFFISLILITLLYNPFPQDISQMKILTADNTVKKLEHKRTKNNQI